MKRNINTYAFDPDLLLTKRTIYYYRVTMALNMDLITLYQEYVDILTQEIDIKSKTFNIKIKDLNTEKKDLELQRKMDRLAELYYKKYSDL